MAFSGEFSFDHADRIPLVMNGPDRDTAFLAGVAVGQAYVEDEDGEPCITEIVLGNAPAIRTYKWNMANGSERHCFEQMRAGLMACGRFNDWLSDSYAFEAPSRRAA